MKAHKVAEVHMNLERGAPLPPQALFLALARTLPGYTVEMVRDMDQDDGLLLMDWLDVEGAAHARDRLERSMG